MVDDLFPCVKGNVSMGTMKVLDGREQRLQKIQDKRRARSERFRENSTAVSSALMADQTGSTWQRLLT
jgi:hypothetical protein